QRVKKGENLIVLEAMKMENEIVADEDGVIRSILVKANDSVESDQPLLIL
ncbi:MAG: acetyl-CoA carboxylase biotin carboxyl carrier protein subunit, partial [Trichococcus flocculiformis]